VKYPDFYPSIEEYLESLEEDDIDVSSIEDIVNQICLFVDITPEVSQTIVELFFKEIRANLLKNKKIDIKWLGKFSISDTKLKGLKLNFTPTVDIVQKINK
jgi:nucleoid DNA-binding protein